MKYLYNARVLEVFDLMTSARVLMAVTLVLLVASLLAGCAQSGDPTATPPDVSTAPPAP